MEKKEKYKPLTPNRKSNDGPGVYTGIVLVANAVERTPPYVEDVVPGSPADKAKLKPDDLIVYVDGLPVGDINTFNDIAGRYHPNQTVKLEIQRDRKLQTDLAEAGETEDQEAAAKK